MSFHCLDNISKHSNIIYKQTQLSDNPSKMKSFTILSILSLAFASPIVEKRSCQNFYQPILNTLSSHQPDDGSAGHTTPFYVFNQIGKQDLLASFRPLPSNIYGCTLQFNYVPGKNAVVSKQSGNPTRIDVYRVSDGGNFPYTPTWDNTAPRTGSLVGTFNFPSDLTKPTVININSFTCDAIMDFRFTVSDPNAIGGVTVDEDSSSGLRIQYDC
jgi:hypothetical protein